MRAGRQFVALGQASRLNLVSVVLQERQRYTKAKEQKEYLQAVDLQQSNVITVDGIIVPLLVYDRLLHFAHLQ